MTQLNLDVEATRKLELLSVIGFGGTFTFTITVVWGWGRARNKK